MERLDDVARPSSSALRWACVRTYKLEIGKVSIKKKNIDRKSRIWSNKVFNLGSTYSHLYPHFLFQYSSSSVIMSKPTETHLGWLPIPYWKIYIPYWKIYCCRGYTNRLVFQRLSINWLKVFNSINNHLISKKYFTNHKLVS